MKIAVFGGSFNPVHLGHINLVTEIIKDVMLDKVIIMPANISPFKQNSTSFIADGKDRIEMCRLAFLDFPNVIVSDFEVNNTDVSYTVNTLRHLRSIYPDDKLYFIMGSDMLFSLEKWYLFEEIMSLCTIIAASRVNLQSDFDELEKVALRLREFGEVLLVSTSAFEVSSTLIREEIMKNHDITCYVPQNVVKYILDMNLYRN